jgi:hypothetical protein
MATSDVTMKLPSPTATGLVSALMLTALASSPWLPLLV